MRLERTTTGVIIHDVSDIIKRKVLRYFSLSSPTREYFVYNTNRKKNIINVRGFIEDSLENSKKFDHDTIYITSGFLNTRDQIIQNLPRPKEIKPRIPAKVTLNMNRQPRSPLQEDCISKMVHSKSPKITIELKPGTGKGHPYSTKIPSPLSNDGYICMGDLKEGDMVFDQYGNPTKVMKIFELGEEDVYRVNFEDGRSSYCTADHLWYVNKDFSYPEYETISLKNMNPYFHSYSIPYCKPVNYPKQDVPIDPWFLGYYLENGIFTNEQLTIRAIVIDIIEKISKEYGYHYQALENYEYALFDENDQPIYTKDVFQKIPEVLNHEIPLCYIINDVETRKALLNGIFNATGFTSHNNEYRYTIQYMSTTENFIQQLKTMIYSLGETCDVRHYDTYCIIFNSRILYDLPEKNTFIEHLDITSIDYSHREKCRCIMVENEEHLYLTEDYIVTHNTFIALYSISKLELKPLIICPTTLLKNQWIEEIIGLGIDTDDIARNIYDGPDKKVTVVTVSSIENAIRDDWDGLLDVISKAAYGIKIVDEAHLHLKGVLKLDAICNIPYNWYLSATLGRSDPAEDNILNRALSDADRFVGNSNYVEYQKQFVNIFFQDIYYYPSNELCMEHFKYGSKGLIRASYYNMLFAYKGGKPFLDNIINITKRTKSILRYEGKILVLIPLIKIIDKVKELMDNDPYFSKYDTATVDGSMPMSQREFAMEADFILSTSMSMGTGVDVKNLAAVINFDQYSSPIINEQIFGRLRDRGKETWYVDVCDHVRQAKMIENWGRKRRALMPYFPGARSNIKLLPKITC